MTQSNFTRRLRKIVSDPVVLPEIFTDSVTLNFSFPNKLEIQGGWDQIAFKSTMLKIPELRGPNLIWHGSFGIDLLGVDVLLPSPSDYIFRTNFYNQIPFFGFQVPFEISGQKTFESEVSPNAYLSIGSFPLTLDTLNLSTDYQGKNITLELWVDITSKYAEGF